MVNIFYPTFGFRLLPRMLGISVLGGLMAGVYGVIHDQITYTISPDYFTQMKFDQFAWANLGWPPRVFVAEIGFIASWWVGLFSAWFLARLAVPAWPPALAFRRSMGGFLIVWASAILAAVIGGFLGHRPGALDDDWQSMADALGVTDAQAFVQVGYIHNGSYVGGAAGLVIACIRLLHLKRAPKTDV